MPVAWDEGEASCSQLPKAPGNLQASPAQAFWRTKLCLESRACWDKQCTAKTTQK